MTSATAEGQGMELGSRTTGTFEKTKQLQCSAAVLANYVAKLPIHPLCNFLLYGLEPVPAHLLQNVQERPTAFVSRTLGTAERNYAQLDKEAPAIALGVKIFHSYICGRDFTTWTDHKPLLGLLGETKPVPNQVLREIFGWHW